MPQNWVWFIYPYAFCVSTGPSLVSGKVSIPAKQRWPQVPSLRERLEAKRKMTLPLPWSQRTPTWQCIVWLTRIHGSQWGNNQVDEGYNHVKGNLAALGYYIVFSLWWRETLLTINLHYPLAKTFSGKELEFTCGRKGLQLLRSKQIIAYDKWLESLMGGRARYSWKAHRKKMDQLWKCVSACRIMLGNELRRGFLQVLTWEQLFKIDLGSNAPVFGTNITPPQCFSIAKFMPVCI